MSLQFYSYQYHRSDYGCVLFSDIKNRRIHFYDFVNLKNNFIKSGYDEWYIPWILRKHFSFMIQFFTLTDSSVNCGTILKMFSCT